MDIKYVIVHNINKVTGRTGATIQTSEHTLDNTDENVIKLVTELNDRYRVKNQTNGVFNPEATTRFRSELETFLNQSDEESFIGFTQRTAGDLRTQIDPIAPARGGFLVFAQYHDYRDYVAVFFVRDTKGMLFRMHGGSFNINQIDHIDFEKMSMACRINEELFSTITGRYLSFINKTTDAASKYFSSWISAADIETNKEDTKNLHELFKTLEPPVDEQGNQQNKDEFLNNVYRHITSSPLKQVNISDLSRTYFGDETFLSQEIDRQGLNINTEFKAHPGMLRRFAQVRAKANGIELNFPQNLYREVIRISDNNPDQIIIDSPALAREVEQLANPSS
jgi:nucleoid-associated protein YejK